MHCLLFVSKQAGLALVPYPRKYTQNSLPIAISAVFIPLVAASGRLLRTMPPLPARGLVSQPSVSMNLIQAESIPAGSEIWVEDEDDGGQEVWMLATVVEQTNTLLIVRKKKTGEEVEIDLVSKGGATAGVLAFAMKPANKSGVARFRAQLA